MYRGEHSAVIPRLMSKVSVKRVEVVVRSGRNALLLILQSCDFWMVVKETQIEKKKELVILLAS